MSRTFTFIIMTMWFALSAQATLPVDTIELKSRWCINDSECKDDVIELTTLHNFFGSTTVGIDLTVYGHNLDIHGAEIYLTDENDSTFILRSISPIEYSIECNSDEAVKTHFHLKFPYTSYLGNHSDKLNIFTDRGILHVYLDEDMRTAELLAKQQTRFDGINKDITNKNRWLISVLILVLFCSALATFAILVFNKRRRIQTDNEIDRLKMLLSEDRDRNILLKSKVNELYKHKFDTLNLLCNEYFEKGQSEKLRLTIFNEVEKEIMKLRSPKTLAELETSVNMYMENIMACARSELTTLRPDDFILLIYLYSGLSARAICILTNIQVKNFYARRQRLKDKILASGTPHSALFAEAM